jgi:hypothetical protein
VTDRGYRHRQQPCLQRPTHSFELLLRLLAAAARRTETLALVRHPQANGPSGHGLAGVTLVTVGCP